MEEYDVVVSTVSPTFVRSYHIDPGQGNWEASMWKCELSGGSWGLGGHLDGAVGGGGALGQPGFTGPAGEWVLLKSETRGGGDLHPVNSREGNPKFQSRGTRWKES